MKQKFSRKLGLNKSTISNLNSTEMSYIKGGLTRTDPRVCKTYESECSKYQTVYYTCQAGCPPCKIV